MAVSQGPLAQAHTLAVGLYEAGRFTDAAAACRIILDADASRTDTLLLLGLCGWELGDRESALRIFDLALRLRPDFPEALNNRGLLLLELDRPEDALADFDRALLLRSDYAKACNNRGNALAVLGRLTEALAGYDHAVRLDPNYVDAHYNRGNVLQEQLRLGEAVASYARVLELRPDYADAHWNRGLCLLVMGNLPDGWEAYEWCWRLPANQGSLAALGLQQPILTPEMSVRGRSVLLVAEQWFGDTLQFCRFASVLADQGAKIILEVQTPLVSLVRSLPGVDQVISQGAGRPNHDLCCPLLSLPGLLKMDMDSIPAQVPYLKEAPELRAKWQQMLGRFKGLRIGLAWSGSQKTKGDQRHKFPSSCPLAIFSRLLAVDGIQFVSLQREVLESDQAALATLPIRHFGERLRDFADTAALTSLMDLVITIDTSIAHLAGAIGRPTWVLLPYFHDWRWFLHREYSPWYPTVRLFRQQSPQDWGGVIARVSRNVAERLGASS
jgi:tetratricopeptide (TPR) repeat protein